MATAAAAAAAAPVAAAAAKIFLRPASAASPSKWLARVDAAEVANRWTDVNNPRRRISGIFLVLLLLLLLVLLVLLLFSDRWRKTREDCCRFSGVATTADFPTAWDSEFRIIFVFYLLAYFGSAWLWYAICDMRYAWPSKFKVDATSWSFMRVDWLMLSSDRLILVLSRFALSWEFANQKIPSGCYLPLPCVDRVASVKRKIYWFDTSDYYTYLFIFILSSSSLFATLCLVPCAIVVQSHN